MADLSVNVLMRCSKKTGKVDTVMTGMGTAIMKLWAVQNTPRTKMTLVFEQESGKVLYVAKGNPDGFPKVKDAKRDGDLGTCEDYGISLTMLQSIEDDRF